jgi:transcriptional regulator with XRE-family HTH domain
MFGKNVKRLRIEKGMTQASLSSAAKIYMRYYQDIEACRKIPSVVFAARLKAALDCEWEDLMRGVK